MCELRSKEKTIKEKPKKKKYNGQQQKEMDSNEPQLMSNEKTQPIQWIERPTCALVVAGSLQAGGEEEGIAVEIGALGKNLKVQWHQC